MSQPHKNLEDYTLQDCSLVGILTTIWPIASLSWLKIEESFVDGITSPNVTGTGEPPLELSSRGGMSLAASGTSSDINTRLADSIAPLIK